MDDKRTKYNECWTCIHRRKVRYSAHISCNDPSKEMKGDKHGINHGWFNYPLEFDPVWKIVDCENYEPDEEHE